MQKILIRQYSTIFQDIDVPTRYLLVGFPYENLNAVLRYYGINLGVRAILLNSPKLLYLNAYPVGIYILDFLRTGTDQIL